MSLKDMSKDELLAIADEFGTEATQDLNETQIITRLMEDGVTQAMVDTFIAGKLGEQAVVEDEVVVTETVTTEVKKPGARAKKTTVATAVVPEQVLLLMDRENPTYKIRGYTFTREHPFALVKSGDAEYIVEHEEGFRYATPKEAREFYG